MPPLARGQPPPPSPRPEPSAPTLTPAPGPHTLTPGSKGPSLTQPKQALPPPPGDRDPRPPSCSILDSKGTPRVEWVKNQAHLTNKTRVFKNDFNREPFFPDLRPPQKAGVGGRHLLVFPNFLLQARSLSPCPLPKN